MSVAGAIGTDPARLLSWCTAFAGMCALESAESRAGDPHRVQALAALVAQA